MKKQYKILAAFVFSAGTLVLINNCGSGLSGSTTPSSANQNSTTYTQIERLGRPAINEGLVLSNANLNAFNSIPPSSDLMSSNTAVAAVLTEAQAVLTVVHNLGIVAGAVHTQPTVAAVVSQFLPDTLRINVNDSDVGVSHAYPLIANIDRTSNSRQEEVGYTSCLSTVANTPLLCGGRKIRDDVIDITLSYIAVGAAAAVPSSGSLTTVPTYAVSDNINYLDAHPATQPLLSAFPFLAAPL